MSGKIKEFIESQTGFLSENNSRYQLESKIRKNAGVNTIILIDKVMDAKPEERVMALEFLISKLGG